MVQQHLIFKSVHDPLKAHKAWFFFDNEYVCLGAGINSDADIQLQLH
jgi:chondroitin AC lyase